MPSGPRMTKGTLLANRNGAVVTSRLHPWPAPQIYVSAVVTTAFRVPLSALLSLEVENKEPLIVSYNARGLAVSLNLLATTTLRPHSATTTCTYSEDIHD